MFICRPQPTSGALYSEEDFVIMTTTEKEKYKCLLPSLTAGEEVSTPNTFWEWHSCLSKELWELVTELVCTSRARQQFCVVSAQVIITCLQMSGKKINCDTVAFKSVSHSTENQPNSSGPKVVWSVWYVQTVKYNMWTAMFVNRFFLYIFISSKLS